DVEDVAVQREVLRHRPAGGVLRYELDPLLRDGEGADGVAAAVDREDEGAARRLDDLVLRIEDRAAGSTADGLGAALAAGRDTAAQRELAGGPAVEGDQRVRRRVVRLRVDRADRLRLRLRLVLGLLLVEPCGRRRYGDHHHGEADERDPGFRLQLSQDPSDHVLPLRSLRARPMTLTDSREPDNWVFGRFERPSTARSDEDSFAPRRLEVDRAAERLQLGQLLERGRPPGGEEAVGHPEVAPVGRAE